MAETQAPISSGSQSKAFSWSFTLWGVLKTASTAWSRRHALTTTDRRYPPGFITSLCRLRKIPLSAGNPIRFQRLNTHRRGHALPHLGVEFLDIRPIHHTLTRRKNCSSFSMVRLCLRGKRSVPDHYLFSEPSAPHDLQSWHVDSDLVDVSKRKRGGARFHHDLLRVAGLFRIRLAPPSGALARTERSSSLKFSRLAGNAMRFAIQPNDIVCCDNEVSYGADRFWRALGQARGSPG